MSYNWDFQYDIRIKYGGWLIGITHGDSFKGIQLNMFELKWGELMEMICGDNDIPNNSVVI